MINLDTIPDKFEDKRTTTRKFKEDLYNFIEQKNVKTVLEIGSYAGYSALVISPLLNKLTCVDFDSTCIEASKNLNKNATNIYYRCENVYKIRWNYGYHDMAIIDCGHSAKHILMDINNTLSFVKPMYVVFDDYGLFPAIKQTVDYFVKKGVFTIMEKIGCPPGTHFPMSESRNTTKDKKLVDYEGVICGLKNSPSISITP